MKLHSIPLRTRSIRGFTLVEVQISIAVIGLMAAIAVPHVSRISGQAQQAKERANAQNLMSVAVAASAAGVVFTDLDSAVIQLTSAEGVVVNDGAFAGARYRLTSLSGAEAEEAKRYLRFADGQVILSP
jgi:prepilin-type N-terminal cleavage/methylation domain-containing protein